MPYMLIRSSLNPTGFGNSTFIDYHTEVGEQGEFRFPDAMSQLGATCIRCGGISSCYLCCSYQTDEPPYKVLNSLEKHGFKVVAANSATHYHQSYDGQPAWQIWTLHKQA